MVWHECLKAANGVVVLWLSCLFRILVG